MRTTNGIGASPNYVGGPLEAASSPDASSPDASSPAVLPTRVSGNADQGRPIGRFYVWRDPVRYR